MTEPISLSIVMSTGVVVDRSIDETSKQSRQITIQWPTKR